MSASYLIAEQIFLAHLPSELTAVWKRLPTDATIQFEMLGCPSPSVHICIQVRPKADVRSSLHCRKNVLLLFGKNNDTAFMFGARPE